MGKILTEADLRSMRLSEDFNEVHIGKDVFVTELAMDYMKKHGIRLVRENTVCSGGKTMSYTPIKKNGAFTYVDAENGKGSSRTRSAPLRTAISARQTLSATAASPRCVKFPLMTQTTASELSFAFLNR